MGAEKKLSFLAFCAVSGWGCGQRGRCPSHELVFLLPMSGSFLLVVHNSPAVPAADEIRVQKKRVGNDAPELCSAVLWFMDFSLFCLLEIPVQYLLEGVKVLFPERLEN